MTAFGESPSFREGLSGLGMYVLDVPANSTAWLEAPERTSPFYWGTGRPRQPRLRSGQGQIMGERVAAVREEAWQVTTVGHGSQVPSVYRFGTQRGAAHRQKDFAVESN